MSAPSSPPPDHDSADQEPVVLGSEYAAALAAEQHHQDSRDGESLLAGIGYDFWAGELDTHRFVKAPADEPVGALVEAFMAGDAATQATIRSSLSMDALYAVLTYSRRCSVRALRDGSAAAAIDAIKALALVDSERVDWRDTLVAMGLASHVLSELAPEAGSTLTLTRQLAEPKTARLMGRFASPSPDTDLADWGYMQVVTSAGRGLIQRGIGVWMPTVDLVELALRIGDVIERDTYRVTSISAAEKLHAVWLPGAPRSDLETVLAGCRAVVSMNARLRPAAHPTSESQQFTVFVAELGEVTDAGLLHRWSAIRPDSTHVSLAWDHGRVFVLLIARSFVAGVEPFETKESVERFRQPVADVIANNF
jgi:hypothetical protein